MKIEKIKKYLLSKVVQDVSGVKINIMTLQIYDDTMRKEFEDHVHGAQFQISTFYFYMLMNVINCIIQTYNLITGQGVIVLLVGALISTVFTVIWYATNRYRRLYMYSSNFWAFYYLLLILNNLVSINLDRSNLFSAKFSY